MVIVWNGTGAGGSIGSSDNDKLLNWNRAIYFCLKISEFALYQIEQELCHRG